MGIPKPHFIAWLINDNKVLDLETSGLFMWNWCANTGSPPGSLMQVQLESSAGLFLSQTSRCFPERRNYRKWHDYEPYWWIVSTCLHNTEGFWETTLLLQLKHILVWKNSAICPTLTWLIQAPGSSDMPAFACFRTPKVGPELQRYSGVNIEILRWLRI